MVYSQWAVLDVITEVQRKYGKESLPGVEEDINTALKRVSMKVSSSLYIISIRMLYILHVLVMCIIFTLLTLKDLSPCRG